MHRRLVFSTTTVVVVALVAMLSGIAASQGPSRPTAIVALGDSYISGEAAGDYVAGTDTDANQCHRSTRSLITATGAADIDAVINLACSGATTADLRLGGTARAGEAAQAEQLRAVAERYDVRAVVVSVGGNDIGYGAIIRDCIAAFLPFVANCRDGVAARLPAKLAEAAPAIGAVLDDVRSVLAETGNDAAEVVLLSYPSPVTEKVRTPWLRLAMGCPFTLTDLAYARSGLTPSIAEAWRAVALAHGTRFLDLSRAFEGHEVCAKGTAPGSEWAKGIFVNTAQIAHGIGLNLVGQSLHPNAVGHAELGRCVGRFLAMIEASALCLADPAAGGDLDAVATSAGPLPTAPPPVTTAPPTTAPPLPTTAVPTTTTAPTTTTEPPTTSSTTTTTEPATSSTTGTSSLPSGTSTTTSTSSTTSTTADPAA